MLHHATGFCAAMWNPIARQLAMSHTVFALDARGHGDSTHATDDLVEVSQLVLERQRAATFVGVVGHSLGGIAALTAAVTAPNLFERLLLIEPVLIPKSGPGARKAGRTPFSLSARLRRASFSSRDEARSALVSQQPYASFGDQLMTDYLHHCWVDLAGGGVGLKCAPALEAKIYELGHTEVLERLSDLKARTRIVAAEHGNFGEAYDALADRFDFVKVAGGHTLPLEIPDEIARIARQWLSA